MGYVVEGIAYVSGVLMIGAGLYLAMRASFPGWWERRLLWPLVNVTPPVARLQGAAAIGLGVSMLALVFTTVAPSSTGGGLVLLAMLMYVVAAGLFLYSTWLSRRPAS